MLSSPRKYYRYDDTLQKYKSNGSHIWWRQTYFTLSMGYKLCWATKRFIDSILLGSCRENEIVYKTDTTASLKPIIVVKLEQTQTSNFFYVSWVAYKTKAPVWSVPVKLGLVNFSLLSSSLLVFYWHIHPIASRRRISKGHRWFPNFCLSGWVEKWHFRSCMRTRFRTSAFPSHSQIQREPLQVIQWHCLLYLSLFIFSFNFQWVVRLCYCKKNWLQCDCQ